MDEVTRERWKVRLAKDRDVEALIGVINPAFRKAESFVIGDRDRVDEETVRSLLRRGEFLIVFDGGDAVACVYVEKRGERAYLGLLAVDPTRQRAGLGSMLMDAAEKHCAGAGCRMIDIRMVSVRRELPTFYQHRGYVETGTEPFPAEISTKIPCHFVTMSKVLT